MSYTLNNGTTSGKKISYGSQITIEQELEIYRPKEPLKNPRVIPSGTILTLLAGIPPKGGVLINIPAGLTNNKGLISTNPNAWYFVNNTLKKYTFNGESVNANKPIKYQNLVTLYQTASNTKTPIAKEKLMTSLQNRITKYGINSSPNQTSAVNTIKAGITKYLTSPLTYQNLSSLYTKASNIMQTAARMKLLTYLQNRITKYGISSAGISANQAKQIQTIKNSIKKNLNIKMLPTSSKAKGKPLQYSMLVKMYNMAKNAENSQKNRFLNSLNRKIRTNGINFSNQTNKTTGEIVGLTNNQLAKIVSIEKALIQYEKNKRAKIVNSPIMNGM
jgi:hypothetical protein